MAPGQIPVLLRLVADPSLMAGAVDEFLVAGQDELAVTEQGTFAVARGFAIRLQLVLADLELGELAFCLAFQVGLGRTRSMTTLGALIVAVAVHSIAL